MRTLRQEVDSVDTTAEITDILSMLFSGLYTVYWVNNKLTQCIITTLQRLSQHTKAFELTSRVQMSVFALSHHQVLRNYNYIALINKS